MMLLIFFYENTIRRMTNQIMRIMYCTVKLCINRIIKYTYNDNVIYYILILQKYDLNKPNIIIDVSASEYNIIYNGNLRTAGKCPVEIKRNRFDNY